MRIGNGPRLVVPRPGMPRRRGWYGHYRDRGQAYDEWRELERQRLRKATGYVAGDRKSWVVHRSWIGVGNSYRLVDGHGRTHGPRFIFQQFNIHQRMRPVARQPETLHSQLSRMLKRAHKDAMRED